MSFDGAGDAWPLTGSDSAHGSMVSRALKP